MTLKLLLDSGAYSAFTQKKPIDIDDYIEYVRSNQEHIELYFNLDVLGDREKSYNNWVYMRSKGLNPIPVFHIVDDRDYGEEHFLKKYLRTCDYVAIGAVADMSTAKRLESLDRIWLNHLTDSEGIPTHKIHGFGLTSIRVMKNYPWYSVDSTSWVMFGRYGAILIPKTYDGQYIYDENPFIVTVSSKSPKQKKKGAHFKTYPPAVQRKLLLYIEEMGFKLADLEEIHHQRDLINMLYYVGVQNSLPKWPWSWNPKRLTVL